MDDINTRIEQILRGENIEKKLWFSGLTSVEIATAGIASVGIASDRNIIIQSLNKIQHTPLNNICFYDVKGVIMSAIYKPLLNIIQHSGLSKLKLVRCAINADELTTMLTLVQNASLRELKLSWVCIREPDARIIANLVRKSLINLSLPYCKFKGDALSIIMDAIATSSLQCLTLHKNIFIDTDTDIFTATEAAIISSCIEHSSLIKLHLFGKFTNCAIIIIAEAIQNSLLRRIRTDYPFLNNKINKASDCTKRSPRAKNAHKLFIPDTKTNKMSDRTGEIATTETDAVSRMKSFLKNNLSCWSPQ